MTAPKELMAHIAQAQGYVRNAQERWNASNATDCADSTEALRLAVAEMEAACNVAASGPAAPGAKTRIERLRSDVDGLARLVDAATAFCRGLALRATTEEFVHSEVKG